MNLSISKLARRLGAIAAVGLLAAAMGGTWTAASAAPPGTVSAVTQPATAEHPTQKSARGELTGKLNLNTATEDQLMLLPRIGASKAERIIAWRQKYGGFKRIADLRRVKGFGYKTFKRLEVYLAVTGETTLAPK